MSCKKYFIILIVLVFVVSLSNIIFQIEGDKTSPITSIYGCSSEGYNNQNFMAYCAQNFYGDYEHWVMLNDPEKEIHPHIQQANVIFLGSSRTMHGFSTESTIKFFDELQIKHYVLGFGYVEGVEFAQYFLKKVKAKPKILVINADPFFRSYLSEEAKHILSGRKTVKPKYILKGYQQELHRYICQSDFKKIAQTVNFCGTTKTIYRDKMNGHWETVSSPEQHIEINTVNTGQFSSIYTEAQQLGELFIQQIGLPSNCIVLTAIPRVPTEQEFVRKLAKNLDTEYIQVPLIGLIGRDTGHLSENSAEKWSADFLQKMKPILDRCLNRVSTN